MMYLTLRISIIFLILMLVWQGIVTLGVPFYLLPAPEQVAAAFVSQFNVILVQAIPTIIETLLGFILGILFGCSAALMIVFFRPLKHWFLPILIISQAIPTFAIAPLLILWFGYGITSKIIVTILMIFFPITSAFYDGLTTVNPGWIHLAKIMNAKKWRLFWYIRIPAALPSLASGIRIAAVIAPIGAIIGEWIGASHGLGYLMLNANARMQIDMMFASLIVIILLALLLYFSVDKILRVFIWW